MTAPAQHPPEQERTKKLAEAWVATLKESPQDPVEDDLLDLARVYLALDSEHQQLREENRLLWSVVGSLPSSYIKAWSNESEAAFKRLPKQPEALDA